MGTVRAVHTSHMPDNRLTRLSLLVCFTAIGCAPPGSSMMDEAAEAEADHNVGEYVATGEQVAEWNEIEGWLVGPTVTNPMGASRVAVLVTMGVADVQPVIEARRLRQGATGGAWLPVEYTWSDFDQHVGIVELGEVVDGAEVRVRQVDAEMIQQLRYSAVLVEELPPEEPAEEEVGASSDALSRDLEAAGVISRERWGARRTRCTSRNTTKTRIAIHHTVTGATNPERQMRGIQAYHMDGRNWCDVGYHFLVGIDGSVFEGRPLELLGSHVGNHNTGNVGISLIGCFQNSGCAGLSGPRTPPEAMLCSAGRVAHVIARRYGINISDSTLKGHRHHSGASTSCPGDNTVSKLGQIRNTARSGSCGAGSPPPSGPRPPASAGRCVHSYGGTYGDKACSAGWQCCGGEWHTRDDGCGSCACVEESGTDGCEGAAAPPPAPETVSCVHSFGGTYPDRGCSAGWQCCGGDWTTRDAGCGACTCLEESGTKGCAVSSPPADPAPQPTPPGASCVHSYGAVYGNTACSAGWQCCDGKWKTRDEGCGGCACVEGTGTIGCGQATCDAGAAGGHGGLSQGGSEIPRAGLTNPTLKSTLGISTEPYGDRIISDGLPFVRGKVSWFGGPNDRSISPSGTGAITGEKVRLLNDPVNPSAAVLAERPADYYWIAMRWSYSPNGRDFWRNARFILKNPHTGDSVVARAVDWGPHTRTGRTVDLSPQVMSDLGLVTDQNVLVAFAAPGTPLGPMGALSCGGSSDGCGGKDSCGECTGEAGCGWCESTGRCVAESERASCGNAWRAERSACEPCDANTCGTCAASGFCSWCPGVGCVNDAIPSEVAMCGGNAIANPWECG